ncbi:heat shock protein GrpE [Desulfocucumis palustris]|uniref:Protein GrpE n=1 Tax=Desulfocucumis palustris TaxID=1898651 RepID=A0A2L2XB03_9FIRM|nr:nucleotide exchange factor GrpE [Desulfocucumis palustris]GBF33164.1 heat shock protein GrpE [Desulfocucumis palustris]
MAVDEKFQVNHNKPEADESVAEQAESEVLANDGENTCAGPGEHTASGPEEMPGEESPRELAEKEKARAEEYYDRLVRLQADFENFRRRTQKEKEDFYKYASEQLIVALLPVLDNFQRALEVKDDDPRKVVEGVEMIYRQIEDVLRKEGLERIAARGEQFDPARHEAVMQEPAGENPDNTVTQEFRCGYCLKGKVIRPAMVKVAKV